MQQPHPCARSAADFVARFSAAWTDPSPERLAALVHAETRNYYSGIKQPLNRDGVFRLMATGLKLLPDLRIRVLRWAAAEDVVYIEWAAAATLGRKSVHWRGTDVVTLEGDKEIQAFVYFDPAILRRALLPRPEKWWQLFLALRHARG